MAVQLCIKWMSIKKNHLQHLIRMATFVFILICSEALLNCHLTMSMNKATKYSYVKKCFSHIDTYFIEELWSYISYFILS